MDRLGEVDHAIAVLRSTGACGRGAVRPGSPQLGSLGLHFNVDVPDLRVGTILAHLRAFMLLDPWLRATSFATRSQRVAAPPDFSNDYTCLVLSPDYRPDLASFADDYLTANPSRDRALDLLPLLLHLDAQRVRRLLPREKIRIRLRCKLCGRPRAVYRKFGICRICFRNMASDGLIPGVKKASW